MREGVRQINEERFVAIRVNEADRFGGIPRRQRFLCRRLLDGSLAEPPVEQLEDTLTPHRAERCPICGGAMIILGILPRPTPDRASFWDDTS